MRRMNRIIFQPNSIGLTKQINCQISSLLMSFMFDNFEVLYRMLSNHYILSHVFMHFQKPYHKPLDNVEIIHSKKSLEFI